jgi:hypothetical protein
LQENTDIEQHNLNNLLRSNSLVREENAKRGCEPLTVVARLSITREVGRRFEI